jgi:hypothetical protein
MALPWTLHLHAVRYSCDESTFGHGKHQTFSLASSATSRAHRCKEDRRLDGCKEGPSKASPAESCELCNRTEPLLAPLPTLPPDPVVLINGPLAVFWGDTFPGYWLTPEVLSDIVRLSGADTSTYSRSNVSIESTNTPFDLSSQWSLEPTPSMEGGEAPREALDLPVGGSRKLLDGDAKNSSGFNVDDAPSTTPCCSSSSRNGKQSSWEFSLASAVAAELLLVGCKSWPVTELGLKEEIKLSTRLL